MNWQDCIKSLKGRKVITHKGDEATIERFDMSINLYGEPVGKYEVRFNPAAHGWYTWDELTLTA